MSVSVPGSVPDSAATPGSAATPPAPAAQVAAAAQPAATAPAATRIRPATTEDHAAIAELTVRVYVGEDFVAGDAGYVAVLGDVAGRAEHTELLVAVDAATGQVVGSVAYAAADSDYSELAGDNEAEFRMLVVDPAVRGRGVGEQLVRACVERARATGCTTLRLSTQVNMRAAHRLYGRIGFTRTPDRDWSPVPGVNLLTYGLALPPRYCDRCGDEFDSGFAGGFAGAFASGFDGEVGRHHPCPAGGELEPPRWCAYCRRRMVVQVVPTGWTARCVQHGTISG